VTARQQSSDRAMLDFEEMIKLVSEQTVVCIGDLMLDDFVYGEVSRISPEAPAPFWR
jgi:D-beta-D-heptose 7-phosphate kinase/D-beta-D-heptose 1-phosphate adenosyltransferase